MCTSILPRVPRRNMHVPELTTILVSHLLVGNTIFSIISYEYTNYCLYLRK